jgi:hypothetical protein
MPFKNESALTRIILFQTVQLDSATLGNSIHCHCELTLRSGLLGVAQAFSQTFSHQCLLTSLQLAKNFSARI